MVRGQRILILVTVVSPAGAQIASLRLAYGLEQRGHQPRVIFLYERNPIVDPIYPFEVILPKAASSIGDYGRIAGGLKRQVDDFKPDVVLSFLPLANILGQGIARTVGIRRRVVSHRVPVTSIGLLMRCLDSLAAWLGFYSDVVAVSHSVQKTCAHYPPWLRRRTSVVHNALLNWRASGLTRNAARQLFQIPDGRAVLVAVGRLAAQKNVSLMLDIVQRLDDVVLLIAGEGPDRPQLEKKIRHRGIAEKVRLLGLVPPTKLPDLLAAADIFIQTSLFEGQSNSVLEALETGLPVVAHDIPEQRETLVDEQGRVAGALVAVDDIDGWVAAINELLRDPAALGASQDVAGGLARSFSFDRFISGFEEVLAPDRA